MKKLIIGLGKSGQSAARFLLKRGHQVVAVDKRKDLFFDGVDVKHESELIDFSDVDQVVLSPGVPQSHPLVVQAKSQNIEIVGEVDLGLKSLSNRVVGVTGTNGKTTVTLLVTHVLNHAGVKAYALGNIGNPVTDYESCDNEVAVVELSSFQLETLKSPVLDAAVILNITPDHLDRYKNFEDYASAKLKIQYGLKMKAPLFMLDHDIKVYSSFLTKSKHLAYDKINFKEIIEYFSEVKYTKSFSHFIENLQAAFCLCHEMGVGKKEFLEGLNSFENPSHRLEFVGSKAGVSYYNDSKGTNIESVKRAVMALNGHTWLIAGGVDKGSSYRAWLESFGGRVQQVFAIGESARKIKRELDPSLPVNLCLDLQEAVNKASLLAKAGDNVLLSPGCSSYDMFRDYIHRGEEFKRLVKLI